MGISLFGVICFFKWVSSDSDLIVLILRHYSFFSCYSMTFFCLVAKARWTINLILVIISKKKRKPLELCPCSSKNQQLRWQKSFLDKCLNKATKSQEIVHFPRNPLISAISSTVLNAIHPTFQSFIFENIGYLHITYNRISANRLWPQWTVNYTQYIIWISVCVYVSSYMRKGIEMSP